MAIDSCGIVGGYNLFVDLNAADGGDGSQASPWNDLDLALDNIGTYNQNFDGFLYLNIKGYGEANKYNISSDKVSFLSNTVLRSYSSTGDYDNWRGESNRPYLRFNGTGTQSPTIIHIDNFGTNNIVLESLNTDDNSIGKLIFNYSYLQSIDTDFICGLVLNSTRINVDKTTLRSQVTFFSKPGLNNINLAAGSMLIIGASDWQLKGVNDTDSIFYNGGVLISNQMKSGIDNSREPGQDIRAIGYYSAYNSVSIAKPPTTGGPYVLGLVGNGKDEASWYLPDCNAWGCDTFTIESPAIFTYVPPTGDPEAYWYDFKWWFWRIMVNGKCKKIILQGRWFKTLQNVSMSRDITPNEGKIPDKYLPNDNIILPYELDLNVPIHPGLWNTIYGASTGNKGLIGCSMHFENAIYCKINNIYYTALLMYDPAVE
jgi:hypothetical protein